MTAAPTLLAVVARSGRAGRAGRTAAAGSARGLHRARGAGRRECRARGAVACRLGRSAELRRAGAPDQALAAYAQAEQLLDEESLQVPMQEGRETFTARRESATREHVALLLAAGRADASARMSCAARVRAPCAHSTARIDWPSSRRPSARAGTTRLRNIWRSAMPSTPAQRRTGIVPPMHCRQSPRRALRRARRWRRPSTMPSWCSIATPAAAGSCRRRPPVN